MKYFAVSELECVKIIARSFIYPRTPVTQKKGIFDGQGNPRHLSGKTT